MQLMQAEHPRAGDHPEADLRAVIEAGGIRSEYQPIVELPSRRPVAYEALARGPIGTPLERPDQLFAEAKRRDLLPELEWQCRTAAMEGALAAGLGPNRALFLNVEPSLLASAMPEGFRELARATCAQMPVFVEFTERDLTTNPMGLLGLVDGLRKVGIGIVLDDVGVDPRSLALLSYLQPDVIKLDMSLIQGHPGRRYASVIHAVNAQVERAGAAIVAEGIETEQHLSRAVAIGARYGQGWLFARPGPLPADVEQGHCEPLTRQTRKPTIEEETPFQLISECRPVRQATKRELLQLSLELEAHAQGEGDAAVVLSTFQDETFFTEQSAARYARLAKRAALVGALGVGIPPNPAPLVRGASLDASEDLCGEWNVIVTGPHFAAAFVAKDLEEGAADMERKFEFALTYDRDLVVRAARSMMVRLSASH